MEVEWAKLSQMLRYIDTKTENIERTLRVGSTNTTHFGSSSLSFVNLLNSKAFQDPSLRKISETDATKSEKEYIEGGEEPNPIRFSYQSSTGGIPTAQKQAVQSMKKMMKKKEIESKGTVGASRRDSGLFNNDMNSSIYESFDNELDVDISILSDFKAIEMPDARDEINEAQERYYRRRGNALHKLMEKFRPQSGSETPTFKSRKLVKNLDSKPPKTQRKSKLTSWKDKASKETRLQKFSPERPLKLKEDRYSMARIARLTRASEKLYSNINFKGKLHPFIKEWVNNRVFLKFPVNDRDTLREQLPALYDPNQKLDVIRFAKDMMGKDITKVSLPCYLNEPIGPLHKASEIFAYKEAYEKALRAKDQYLRLGFTIAASFIFYSGFEGKKQKPFNPLLGETHEMFWEDMRVISEQVSHHPPITATYAENDDIEVESNPKIQNFFRIFFKISTFMNFNFLADICYLPKLTLKCMKVQPRGQYVVKYKKTGDKIIYNFPTTAMHNVFWGDRYFHQYGVMTATNAKNGDMAEIHFKEKPFFGTADTKCSGVIQDKYGDVKYLIEGDWKTHIDFIDACTHERIQGLRKIPDPINHPENYSMPLISRNTNYLTRSTLKSICPTDTRFRPDQRALEHQEIDMAGEEKVRLEEAQRRRRRARKAVGVEWEPRWFKLEYDEDVGKEIWKYKGGYFEARKEGKWEDIPKIYS